MSGLLHIVAERGCVLAVQYGDDGVSTYVARLCYATRCKHKSGRHRANGPPHGHREVTPMTPQDTTGLNSFNRKRRLVGKFLGLEVGESVKSPQFTVLRMRHGFRVTTEPGFGGRAYRAEFYIDTAVEAADSVWGE